MPLHTRVDILAETEDNDPTKGTWMFEEGACTETSLDRPNTERDANVAAYAAARDAAIPTRTMSEPLIDGLLKDAKVAHLSPAEYVYTQVAATSFALVMEGRVTDPVVGTYRWVELLVDALLADRDHYLVVVDAVLVWEKTHGEALGAGYGTGSLGPGVAGIIRADKALRAAVAAYKAKEKTDGHS
jgi:hypothetical protein